MFIKLFLIFFIILITGDESMVFLSSIHYIPFIYLFIISITANLISDIFLYFFGNIIVKKLKLKKYKKFKDGERKFKKLLKKIKHPEKVIFFSKFIYGTRVITILAYGRYKPISFKKFLFYNIMSLMAITFVILGIGWIFGDIIAMYLYNGILIAGLLVVVIIFIFKKWLNKEFVRLFQLTKKQKE